MKKQRFVKLCPYCGNEIEDFIKKDTDYRCRYCKQEFRLQEVIREKVKQTKRG